MKTINVLIIFMLLVFSTHLMAYGGSSSSKKKCKKPTLSEVMPAHLSIVPPTSSFSFHTSTATLLHSIRVTANKTPVEVDIKKVANGFVVSGKLPSTLKRKYVRLDFTGTTSNSCQGVDGWLIEIAQENAN